jgi:hypothetical protein
MIFFLNNKFILFKCHILIALNLQSQTAISTITELDSGVKVSVRVLMGSCSGRVRPKTIKLVLFASLPLYAALRRKSKDWLALNQYNVSKWDDNLTLCV